MEPDLTNDPARSQHTNPEDQAEEVQNVMQRAQALASEQARAADRVIRSYPYQSIGIALGLGLIVGLLLGRRD